MSGVHLPTESLCENVWTILFIHQACEPSSPGTEAGAALLTLAQNAEDETMDGIKVFRRRGIMLSLLLSYNLQNREEFPEMVPPPAWWDGGGQPPTLWCRSVRKWDKSLWSLFSECDVIPPVSWLTHYTSICHMERKVYRERERGRALNRPKIYIPSSFLFFFF